MRDSNSVRSSKSGTASSSIKSSNTSSSTEPAATDLYFEFTSVTSSSETKPISRISSTSCQAHLFLRHLRAQLSRHPAQTPFLLSMFREHPPKHLLPVRARTTRTKKTAWRLSRHIPESPTQPWCGIKFCARGMSKLVWLRSNCLEGIVRITFHDQKDSLGQLHSWNRWFDVTMPVD
jgi:hypothetical protein